MWSHQRLYFILHAFKGGVPFCFFSGRRVYQHVFSPFIGLFLDNEERNAAHIGHASMKKVNVVGPTQIEMPKSSLRVGLSLMGLLTWSPL